MNIKQFLKPDWRKIVLILILFSILPERVENEITFFGVAYIIKSFSEVSAPQIDLLFLTIMLIISYLLSCLVTWVYDRYINKFIVGEGEEEIIPEEGWLYEECN